MQNAKEKKPFYKRVWFGVLTVIIVLLVIVIALSGGSSDKNSTSSSSSSKTMTSSSKPSSSSSSTTASSPSSSSTKSLKSIEATDYNPTADTKTADYQAVPYDSLARTPEQYMGKEVSVSGEVMQVTDPGSSDFAQILVDTQGADGDGSKLVELAIDASYFKVHRILENDTVTVYGISYGLDTYDSTGNGQVTVPTLVARFYTDTPMSN